MLIILCEYQPIFAGPISPTASNSAAPTLAVAPMASTSTAAQLRDENDDNMLDKRVMELQEETRLINERVSS